jgi:hypothetical protein
MINTVITQETNVLDVLSSISKKKKKLQAILLQELETVVAKEAPGYSKMRKVILDETSDYARAIVRSIFGDIEVPD